jgi:hypothetical protein
MNHCDNHDVDYADGDLSHIHPERLDKLGLHDALTFAGYSNDHAWQIADEAFNVPTFALDKWNEWTEEDQAQEDAWKERRIFEASMP